MFFLFIVSVTLGAQTRTDTIRLYDNNLKKNRIFISKSESARTNYSEWILEPGDKQTDTVLVFERSKYDLLGFAVISKKAAISPDLLKVFLGEDIHFSRSDEAEFIVRIGIAQGIHADSAFVIPAPSGNDFNPFFRDKELFFLGEDTAKRMVPESLINAASRLKEVEYAALFYRREMLESENKLQQHSPLLVYSHAVYLKKKNTYYLMFADDWSLLYDRLLRYPSVFTAVIQKSKVCILQNHTAPELKSVFVVDTKKKTLRYIGQNISCSNAQIEVKRNMLYYIDADGKTQKLYLK